MRKRKPNGIDEKELRDMLVKCYMDFDEVDRKIILHRILANEPMTQADLAFELGLNRNTVARREKAIIEVIKAKKAQYEALKRTKVRGLT